MSEQVTVTLPRALAEFVSARADEAARQVKSEADRARFGEFAVILHRAIYASPGYFVYIKSLRGYEPQVWPLGLDRRNDKPVPVLQKHPLTVHELHLSIEQLTKLYPYQVPTEKEP